MPTSMWTNSTDAYINYTVYAAPTDRIPDTLRLTAKQVRDRLLGSTLPLFGSELANFIKNSEQSSKFKDLLWLPVVLRAHLPPSPDPPTPYQVVSNVAARFVIRFSGNPSDWERVLEGDSTALNHSIRMSAEMALGRRLYVTEVSITHFKPIKDGGRRTEGLLAYGEARQDRTVMAQHPWDARDIISVLSKGDYSAALALCTGGQAPAKLIAVGLDADFGDVTTVHHLVLFCIVICLAAGTILAVLLRFLISYFCVQTKLGWSEDGHVAPGLSCNKSSFMHLKNTTRLPYPTAHGKQQGSENYQPAGNYIQCHSKNKPEDHAPLGNK
ncbi:unnamed protein product [Phytomonas sp. EM1]|nr:unnamed protein product [Phytomonas sp. EM1]|eukprot:CCW63051.1 unnamed protein product [Phytomonas sp. isolate EM1]